MACHNLCIDYKAPVGIEHLLGLGAKYCLRKTKLSEKTIDTMMKRMRNNVRWKYIFRDEKEDNNYIPNLYIKSEREPDNASEKIERGMDNFEIEVKMLRRRQTKENRRSSKRNTNASWLNEKTNGRRVIGSGGHGQK